MHARSAQPTPSPYTHVLNWTNPQPSPSVDSYELDDFPSNLIVLSGTCQTATPATPRDAVSMAMFSIDCTLPPHGTIFVQPPNARGTLDIVYSCLAVIVLCTWSVLHLNVPVQVVTPANGRRKLMRSLSRMFTKIRWMAINVLAPEWTFAQAICGLITEHRLRAEFDHYGRCDGVPWTRSHTQLANMGGFVIRFDRTLPSSVTPDHVTEQRENMRCVDDEYCSNRRSDAVLISLLHSADGQCRS
jgi:hypothetical protein